MSLKRATTQIIKSYSTISKRLKVLGEQKQTMLDSVEVKYAATQTDLTSQLDQIRNSLVSLGYTDDNIAAMVAEYEKPTN